MPLCEQPTEVKVKNKNEKLAVIKVKHKSWWKYKFMMYIL